MLELLRGLGRALGRFAEFLEQARQRGLLRQEGDVVSVHTAQADLAAGRRIEPRQQLRHQILAPIAWPDQCDMGAEREADADPVEQANAVGEGHIPRFDST